MRESTDVLVNAMAGERVVITRHSYDTDGQVIAFDMILTKVGGSPPAHIHLQQSERFRVISGALDVMVGSDRRVLRPGDEAFIPAGTAHRWWNAGPGDAVVSVELRPALDFEELLDEAFDLADTGAFGADGPIDVVATDAWATKWRDQYRLA